MATERHLPGPLAAAAGIGDLTVQRLRRLPRLVGNLRDRETLASAAGRVRSDVQHGVRSVRDLDRERLRGAADGIGKAARQAPTRAREVYADLVARGERVGAAERGPIKVVSTIAQRAEGKFGNLLVGDVVDDGPAKPGKR